MVEAVAQRSQATCLPLSAGTDPVVGSAEGEAEKVAAAD